MVTVVALQLLLSSHFFFLSTQRVPITCHLSFPVLSRLIDSVSEWQRQIRVAGARGSRACLYDRSSELIACRVMC